MSTLKYEFEEAHIFVKILRRKKNSESYVHVDLLLYMYNVTEIISKYLNFCYILYLFLKAVSSLFIFNLYHVHFIIMAYLLIFSHFKICFCPSCRRFWAVVQAGCGCSQWVAVRSLRTQYRGGATDMYI